MSEGIFKRVRILMVLLFILITTILLATTPKTSLAVSDARRAFASRNVSSVRGTRVEIWSANHPGGWVAITSLTGICTGEPCDITTGFFETGLVKGTITPVDNQLQQFAAYANPYGQVSNIFGLGNLSNNTWYTFQTLYSYTASRWEAWRGSVPVYYNSFLSFTTGSKVYCGAEGFGNTSSDYPPLGAECKNMRYKVGSGSWTQYDYTYTNIDGPYCVYKPYTYGGFGWGPC